MAQNALVEKRTGRLRRVDVTPDLLLGLLQVGQGVVVDGDLIRFRNDAIPDTATALRCGLNDVGNIVLLIQDDTFNEVVEGEIIPQLVPVYEVTYEVTQDTSQCQT